MYEAECGPVTDGRGRELARGWGCETGARVGTAGVWCWPLGWQSASHMTAGSGRGRGAACVCVWAIG